MSLTSPFQPVHIPEHSLYDEIFGTLTAADLERTALTDSATGQSVTFGQLRSMVNALAGALADAGIKPHHVVALHCPNSIAFAVCFHGIMRAGATVTTVNALATAADVEKQLRDSNAKMMFTLGLLGDAGITGAQAVGIPVVEIGQGLMELVGKGIAPPEITIDPVTHLAVLPYSSGTTGNPKGVRLSHRNLLANLYQVRDAFYAMNVTRDSVVLHVLPYFHIYGMNCLLNLGLYFRLHAITMPKFDLPQFLQLLQDHKVSFTFVAPPIAVALAKHPIVDNYDLSALHGMVSGAAALDGELAKAVSTRLGCTVAQGYGMTETSPVTHLRIDDTIPLASIGHPVPNTDFKVVNVETLEEILPPVGEEERSPNGELWVRGPQVMIGYLNNQEADAKTITPEGWLRTGDIVTMDRHGHVYVVDRMKELIKYKGYQVAPAELEALLLTHDSIADAAVVGTVRQSDGEEVPHAFVVAQAGCEIDPEALMEWVAARVAPYKKIRMVDIIDAIPKSVTGKILRKDLRG